MMTAVRIAPPIAALVVAALAAAGCTLALEPTLPTGGPPQVEDGLRLLQVPRDVVERLSQAEVRAHREVFFRRDRTHRISRADAIVRGNVVTGMSPREVVWTFEAHPTRVRDHGPPGGHTYYWEPGRYWVRFNEQAQAVDAGRY